MAQVPLTNYSFRWTEMLSAGHEGGDSADAESSLHKQTQAEKSNTNISSNIGSEFINHKSSGSKIK